MQLPAAWLPMIAAVVIIGAGVLTGVGGLRLLRQLPEPVPTDDAESRAEIATKIRYAAIADRRFGSIVGGCVALATTLAVTTQPFAYWWAWAVYSCFAVLLAGIDARTTWLPTRVVQIGWAALAVSLGIGLLLLPDGRVAAAVSIGAGALIAGVGYFLLWVVTRGRGVAFGDVRLMPLVGAIGGTMAWSGIYWSVLLGSVVGALIGIVRMMRGLRGPFPYAPALVCGPYAAAALLALV